MNQEEIKEEVVEELKEETVEETSEKPKKVKKKDKIEALEEEIALLKDQNIRAYAEMENSKRRLKEESVTYKKYASLSLVADLVNPIDMLVKVCSIEQQSPEMNNFLIGFNMIANQLVDILKQDGLSIIEASKDTDFDPIIHQAVSKEAVEGVSSNKIIEVLQTGYKYKDRVIKPAMVKVSE